MPALRVSEVRHETTITDLPDQILVDIFLRLQTTTVLNCRRVCRSWLSLTTRNDTQFPKLHSLIPHNEILVQFASFGTTSFGLVDPELSTTNERKEYLYCVPVEIEPQFHSLADYGVVNSCRGLICLKKISNQNPAIICNPITGEFITLPHCDKNYRHKPKQDPKYYVSGFGFCSSTNQFKVLRKKSHLEAEINVVGSKSWRKIGCIVPFGPGEASDPIYLNGGIHWLCDVNPRYPKFISAFNFEVEEFREISLPPFREILQFGQSIGVVGGCLVLCDYVGEGKFDIWVMTEYGVEESWSKDFAIDTGYTGLRLRGNHRPIIECLVTGKIVMHLIETCDLVCYDPAEETVRTLAIPLGRRFKVIVHTSSFVSLRDAIIGNNLKVLKVTM